MRELLENEILLLSKKCIKRKENVNNNIDWMNKEVYAMSG